MASSMSNLYDKYISFSKNTKAKEVSEEDKATEMNEFALESKLRKECHEMLDNSFTKAGKVMIDTTNETKALHLKVAAIEKVINKVK